MAFEPPASSKRPTHSVYNTSTTPLVTTSTPQNRPHDTQDATATHPTTDTPQTVATTNEEGGLLYDITKEQRASWENEDAIPAPCTATVYVGSDRTKQHKAIIDSGADCCLVSFEYLKDKLGEAARFKETGISTINTVGSPISTIGSIDLTITMAGKTFDGPADSYVVSFKVIDGTTAGLLLGNDALRPLGTRIDILEDTVTVKGRRYNVRNTRPPEAAYVNGDHQRHRRERSAFFSRAIRAREAVNVKPLHATHIPIHTIPGGLSRQYMLVPNERLNLGDGKLKVTSALLEGGDKPSACEVINYSPFAVRVEKGTILGYAEFVYDDDGTQTNQVNHATRQDQPQPSRAEQEAEFMGIMNKLHINPDLDAAQMAKLTSVLWRNRGAFSTPRRPIGTTDKAIFDVDTGDAKPVTSAPYPTSPHKRAIIRDEVSRMLNLGLIKPSASEWSSPVIVVQQGDKHRVCIDLRKVNKVTRGDQWPIPRLDSILASFEGMQWFSTFDLKKAFNQIPLTEAAAKRLAFRTREGLWEPTRMPFGARGAPATFQRLMDITLAEGMWRWVLAYMDDVINHSKTFDDHCEHIGWTLSRLAEAGLTLDPEKSYVAMRSVDALGHRISNIRIAIGTKGIQAVRNQRKPETVTQLESFNGFCSFYRRFVERFALEIKPLLDLLQESKHDRRHTLSWTPELDAAYERIINLLLQNAVLAHPDYSKPFYLDTDASADGFAAVLSQKDDKGRMRPICFLSRLTTKTERKMAATDLECCAVAWALDKLRCYIEGSEVHVTSDHSAIQHLLDYNGSNGRMMRASLMLADYEGKFHFHWKPGKAMPHVDHLSRSVDATSPHTAMAAWQMCADTLILDRVDAGLAKDDETKKIMDKILEQNGIPPLADNSDRAAWPPVMHSTTGPYTIAKGRLLMHNGYRRNYTIYVPDHDGLRDELIRSFHDTATSAHRGRTRTYLALTDRYYWRGARTDVDRYVATCDSCQRVKRLFGLPPGALAPLPIPSSRWDMVTFDIILGLPASGPEKYNAALVVVDRLTKRVVTAPTHKKATAMTIAQLFFNTVVRYFGMPRIIVTDRDSRVTAKSWRALMKFLGVTHRYATAHHQQTDGQTERVIRTIKEALRHYVNKNGATWLQYLYRVETAHNLSVHSSTGKTPYELDTGRLPTITHASWDMDLVANGPARDFIAKMDADCAEACEAMARAQEAQKRYYDSRHKPQSYDVGDLVLLNSSAYKQPHWKKKKGKKFAPAFWGPFTVTNVPHPNVVELAFPKELLMHNRVSTSNVRPYTPRHDKSTDEQVTCVIGDRMLPNGTREWLALVTRTDNPDDQEPERRWLNAAQMRARGATELLATAADNADDTTLIDGGADDDDDDDEDDD